MRTALVFEGVAEQTIEDNGQALILEIAEDDDSGNEFARLISWCEGGNHHPILGPLAGRRLRVTVELLD